MLVSDPPWATIPCLPLSSGADIAESDLPPEMETLDAGDRTRKEFVPEMLAALLALRSLFLHCVSSVQRAANESYIRVLRTES